MYLCRNGLNGTVDKSWKQRRHSSNTWLNKMQYSHSEGLLRLAQKWRKFQSMLQCELALKILHEEARSITSHPVYKHMRSSYELSRKVSPKTQQSSSEDAGGWEEGILEWLLNRSRFSFRVMGRTRCLVGSCTALLRPQCGTVTSVLIWLISMARWWHTYSTTGYSGWSAFLGVLHLNSE